MSSITRYWRCGLCPRIFQVDPGELTIFTALAHLRGITRMMDGFAAEYATYYLCQVGGIDERLEALPNSVPPYPVLRTSSVSAGTIP